MLACGRFLPPLAFLTLHGFALRFASPSRPCAPSAPRYRPPLRRSIPPSVALVGFVVVTLCKSAQASSHSPRLTQMVKSLCKLKPFAFCSIKPFLTHK